MMITDIRLRRAARITSVVVLTVFLFGFAEKGIKTEQGFYLIDVQFPGAAVVGANTLEITVSDRKSGKPLDRKLAIEVVPWMAAHEHGSMGQAKITYLGKGRYRLDNVSLTMPGEWEIYLKLTDHGSEDTAVFNVVAGK